MKDRKGFFQAYICQAACTEDQIIVSADVSQDENDLHQLEPILEKTTSSLRESGVDGTPTALFWADQTMPEHEQIFAPWPGSREKRMDTCVLHIEFDDAIQARSNSIRG